MNVSKSVIGGMLFLLSLAACGGSEPAEPARYPEPVIGETRGPVTQTPEPAQAPQDLSQVPMQNAAVGADDQVQGQGQATADMAIGTDDSGYADTDPSALQDFREPLAPYGTWVDDASYGTVWVPREDVVGSDFAPYVSGGHWAYDDQYTWVSDYDWGWAPFHYGRWVWAGNRWGWIPGRTYSGAWVVWRTGGYGYGYVGWAPAPPAWYWYGGYPVGVAYVHPVPYVFCHTGDLFHPAVGGRIVTGPQVAQIGAATRPYTAANPSVNGTGRTAATPGVGGTSGSRSLAHPNVGPNPHDMGIMSPPSSQGNAGLAKAQAFASPRTATALGAHAPITAPMRPQPTNANPSGNTIASAHNMPSASQNLPPRLRPTVSSPQYNGISPTPHPQSQIIGRSDAGSSQRPTSWGSQGTSSGSYGSSPAYSHSQVRSSPSYSAPSHPSTPSYQSSQSFSHSYTAPAAHPSTTYSAPAAHAASGGGSRGGGGGGGRGGHR